MSTPDSPTSNWSLPRRLGFRFAFAYFVIYSFPFPLDQLPWSDWFTGAVDQAWHASIPWVAKHVLQLEKEITIFPAGSGDTTFNYVQLLVHLGLALFAALIWSLLDRKRIAYESLHDGLWVYLRLVLATAMLGYGMNKVIQLQFPPPSADRLLTSYGESSPMGLLWTFMGSSTAYTAFAGAGEVLGGLLLLFRRTATLGALVILGVMTNVVALNFCYDVPVKLYSSNLLLMAVYIALPDATRLLAVLITKRATSARSAPPTLSPRWLAIGGRVLWFAFVAWTSIATVTQAFQARHVYGDLAPKAWPSGVYDVEEFIRNGRVEPPLVTNTTQWRRLGFSALRGVAIRSMDDSVEHFGTQNDEKTNTLTFTAHRDKVELFPFHWSRPDAERLVLEGKFGTDELIVRLRASPKQTFFLEERGFHWINEFPLNR